jgi:hypothetical protein
MLLVNIIDFDHLLADPIYDPNRCGIGFHPLHSYLAIAAYLGLTAIPKTRLVGLGLVIHMALNWLDCLWMSFEYSGKDWFCHNFIFNPFLILFFRNSQ